MILIWCKIISRNQLFSNRSMAWYVLFTVTFIPKKDLNDTMYQMAGESHRGL